MARRTLADLYDEARSYLDTDDLNFPDDLCTMLMRRVWFQAVNMETEWRFLLCDAYVDVVAGTLRVPLSFTVPSLAGQPVREAARFDWVRWNDQALTCQVTWRLGDAAFLGTIGYPSYYAEEQDAGVRYLRLYPGAGFDGRVNVSMVLIPAFPATVNDAFVDLPEEFDDALLQALLAEMYMREEDGDLYQFQRSMFMEQMGSIKERWRLSNTERLVVAADARYPSDDRSWKQPKLTGSGW